MKGETARTYTLPLMVLALLAITAACGADPVNVKSAFDQRVPDALDAPALVFVFADN